MGKSKVFIAPGHGEGDPGALGLGHKEHDLVKPIVNAMALRLLQCGVEVHRHPGVRDIPQRIRLQAQMANDLNADLAVQVHLNAFTGSTANGSEVWIFAPGERREAYADKLARSLKDYFFNRGVKNKQFTFLQATKMPAVIVEAGFITNPEDNRTIRERAEDIGVSLANATLDELGVGRPENKPSAPDGRIEPGTLVYRVYINDTKEGSYEVLKNALGVARTGLLQGQKVTILPHRM